MRSSARCGEPDKRAFFGRRKGHRLKPQQAALLDTLLPRLALDLGTRAPTLTSLFDGAVSEGVQRYLVASEALGPSGNQGSAAGGKTRSAACCGTQPTWKPPASSWSRRG